MTTENTSKCAIVLRTADQYPMWKARVGDVCWSATGKDIFAVKDEECKAVIALVEDPNVGKCWNL